MENPLENANLNDYDSEEDEDYNPIEDDGEGPKKKKRRVLKEAPRSVGAAVVDVESSDWDEDDDDEDSDEGLDGLPDVSTTSVDVSSSSGAGETPGHPKYATRALVASHKAELVDPSTFDHDFEENEKKRKRKEAQAAKDGAAAPSSSGASTEKVPAFLKKPALSTSGMGKITGASSSSSSSGSILSGVMSLKKRRKLESANAEERAKLYALKLEDFGIYDRQSLKEEPLDSLSRQVINKLSSNNQAINHTNTTNNNNTNNNNVSSNGNHHNQSQTVPLSTILAIYNQNITNPIISATAGSIVSPSTPSSTPSPHSPSSSPSPTSSSSSSSSSSSPTNVLGKRKHRSTTSSSSSSSSQPTSPSLQSLLTFPFPPPPQPPLSQLTQPATLLTSALVPEHSLYNNNNNKGIRLSQQYSRLVKAEDLPTIEIDEVPVLIDRRGQGRRDSEGGSVSMGDDDDDLHHRDTDNKRSPSSSSGPRLTRRRSSSGSIVDMSTSPTSSTSSMSSRTGPKGSRKQGKNDDSNTINNITTNERRSDSLSRLLEMEKSGILEKEMPIASFETKLGPRRRPTLLHGDRDGVGVDVGVANHMNGTHRTTTITTSSSSTSSGSNNGSKVGKSSKVSQHTNPSDDISAWEAWGLGLTDSVAGVGRGSAYLPSKSTLASSSPSTSLVSGTAASGLGVEAKGDFGEFAKVITVGGARAGVIPTGTTTSSAGGEGQVDKLEASIGDASKYIVEEEIEFAGEKMTVKRVVQSGSATESSLLQRAAAVKKMDPLARLVESLTEKREISTLEKTKIDWAQDKELAGDADELRKAAKDGYLSRQQFLQETEAKREVSEREQRAILRQKQNLANSMHKLR